VRLERPQVLDQHLDGLGLGEVVQHHGLVAREPRHGPGAGDQQIEAAGRARVADVLVEGLDEVADGVGGRVLDAVHHEAAALARGVSPREQAAHDGAEAEAGHGLPGRAVDREAAELGEGLDEPGLRLAPRAVGQGPAVEGSARDGRLPHGEIGGQVVEEPLGLAPAGGDERDGLEPAQPGAHRAGDARAPRALEVVLIGIEGALPLSAEDREPALQSVHGLARPHPPSGPWTVAERPLRRQVSSLETTSALPA